MKACKKLSIGLLGILALLLAGCPSPLTDLSGSAAKYETTATIDTQRMVFVEEDGSETPLIPAEDGGPEEIIDYTVLDDSDGIARSSVTANRIRVIVIGRRSDGRSGVWVIYRHRGMTVIPNEDGLEDPVLLELVSESSTPWYGKDWLYEAKALSDDGKIIIGRLSRPDGWKYEEYLGDVPDPEIGIWWSLNHTDERIFVSRARPMLLMEEPDPEDSIARHHGGRRPRIWNWIELFIEWIQSSILSQAWNYMADVDGFAVPEAVPGGIPEGFYVVSGVDKAGIPSWAWLTATSMEDILPAPDEPPPGNEGSDPWPLEIASPNMITSSSMSLELTVIDDQGRVFSAAQANADPNDDLVLDSDGDPVYFRIRPQAGQDYPDEALAMLGGNLSWANDDPASGILQLDSTNGSFNINLYYEVWTDNDPVSDVPQTEPVLVRVRLVSS